jgi:formamidopyrimidine-DNA glycosylase
VLELPEVEVLRKDLEKEVVGKRVQTEEKGGIVVRTASIVRPFHRTRPEFIAALEGRKIEGCRRRGTTIFLDLDEDLTWVLQARGTATFHRETATEEPGPDTHMVVSFTIGGAIHLSDPSDDPQVSTGVVATEDAMAEAGVNLDAWDPLEDNLTWMEFGRLLDDAAMPLKLLLIDQEHILGFRDVYSDEILYEAGLRFDRESNTLSIQEVRRLYRAIHEVVQAAMKFRGSSLDESTHDDVVDDEGEVSEHLKVYGREGLPSYRSRRPIERAVLRRARGDRPEVASFYDPQSQV